jgi:hypothetical protein
VNLFSFSDLHNDLGAARRLAGAALVANVDFPEKGGGSVVRYTAARYRATQSFTSTVRTSSTISSCPR